MSKKLDPKVVIWIICYLRREKRRQLGGHLTLSAPFLSKKERAYPIHEKNPQVLSLCVKCSKKDMLFEECEILKRSWVVKRALYQV